MGQIGAGEIYNQSPTECRVHGTRRWVTPGSIERVRAELGAIFDEVATTTGTTVSWEFVVPGDAFRLDPEDDLVTCFQSAHTQVTGAELATGTKPFVDDGNVFSSLGGIPALTHGPAATGAHTMEESVPVAELERVARVYALTAASYCR